MKNIFLLMALCVAVALTIVCGKALAENEVTENVTLTFTPEGLQKAAQYSAQRGGSAVLVMQNGEIIFEDYHNGADENTATQIHSATKGFWAVATAAAIEDGIITGYNEVIADTITEWKNITLHPGKKQITLSHLVSLTSGLSQDIAFIQGEKPLARNIYRYVVNNLRLNFMPGTRFVYGPSHYYTFGEFLRRKLRQQGIDQDPLEYLEERIFKPIGLEYQKWIYDEAGNPHIPNGCYITPRNWVKFGQLLLQKGAWNGKQIVARDLMEALFVPQGVNAGHGVFLWLNRPGGEPPAGQAARKAPENAAGGFIFHDGYTDIIACMGAGTNRMYIIPSLNAVVVRQSPGDKSYFSDHDFLALLLK